MMCPYALFEFMKLSRRYEFTRLEIMRTISRKNCLNEYCRIMLEPSKWLFAAIYQQENERLSLIDASMRAILNYEAKCFDNFGGGR